MEHTGIWRARLMERHAANIVLIGFWFRLACCACVVRHLHARVVPSQFLHAQRWVGQMFL